MEEPGCIALLDVRSARSILFLPRLEADHAVWMGETPTLAGYRKKYGVQEVYWTDEVRRVLHELAPPTLHLLSGVNSDSGLLLPPAAFPGLEAFRCECESLFTVVSDARV